MANMHSFKKIDVSIIIVHYRVKNLLLDCIESIRKTTTGVTYEVIVVDNDETKVIQKELVKKFPFVTYVGNDNKGFGQGNNVGAKIAKGTYLFFLNPDTLVRKNTVKNLVHYCMTDTSVGIVAPVLVQHNNSPYEKQGMKELTPLKALFVLSFIQKLFPDNPVSRNYFMTDWKTNTIKDVSVAPGTAFLMKKELFNSIGGFDEKFFLYFEEFDLCKRVKKYGKKIHILPQSTVMHLWGESTKQRQDTKSIFSRSRFYYFKKHYGVLWAFVIELFLQMNKYLIFVLLSLLVGIYVSFNDLFNTMPFYPDIGWYYMSAKNMIQTGTIPLVSMPSSHPWLHQGPYWTYLLAISLVFSPNPIFGAYITIGGFGMTIVLMYIVGKKLFSSRVGGIASLLYSASPLVIMNARTPYHTSIIPLLSVVLLYAMYQWIRGNRYFFPFTIFILAVLYNFEIATAIFGGIFIGIVLYGLWRKKQWMQSVKSKKIILLSIVAYIIPMSPMLAHDFQHNFPQTIQFLMWIGYRILVVFGYPELHPDILPHTSVSMNTFLLHTANLFYFAPSWFVSVGIGFLSFIFLLYQLFNQIQNKKFTTSYILLFLFTVLPLTAIIIMGTVSDAYFIMLFPLFVFPTAVYLAYLFAGIFGKVYVPLLIGIYMIGNVTVLVQENYFQKTGVQYHDKISVAKQIIRDSHGKEYNLRGIGKGSEFASYVMPYEYLAWWMGNAPINQKAEKTFIIEEQDKGIIVIQKDD